MKRLRTLLQDRVSNGVCAGLFGWLLVLNLFVAALSCGMTVPAGAGPLLTMCEPGETVAPDEPTGAHLVHDCPYVIGHDGDALLGPSAAPGADLGPVFSAGETLDPVVAHDTIAELDPGRLGLAPAPRGPPSHSA